ncbi:MAG: hypothetical protein HS111_16595 [Kofleriaceae bacterium]|nr:hypothetical protein [Kofleriaceae bacterium]
MVAPQAGATGGRLWVGRSLALPGLGDGGDAAAAPVVSLVRPTGRLAWAGVGWAGGLGVVTGVNEAGLAIAVHPTITRDLRPTRTARPVALLARDVLEAARDLDAAIKLLEATPTLGAAAFVVVDGAAGRWAVVDRSRPGRRAPRSGRARGRGRPPVAGLRRRSRERSRAPQLRQPAPGGARRSPPARAAGRRRRRWWRRCSTIAAAPRTRACRPATAPPSTTPRRSTSSSSIRRRSSCGSPTVRAPAPACAPSTSGTSSAARASDQGAGRGRPADAMREPQAAVAIRRARAELRTARRLARRDRTRAREHVARALALAPTLPEAHLLAGFLAQAAGDRAAMRAAWERWLELGADDPGEEAAIRAAVAAP